MWPFSHGEKRRRRKNPLDKVVAGVIIGGAIGSIIGKRLLEQKKVSDEIDEDEEHHVEEDTIDAQKM